MKKITMEEFNELFSGVKTVSVKSNDPRGYITVDKSSVVEHDFVILDSEFVEIVSTKQAKEVDLETIRNVFPKELYIINEREQPTRIKLNTEVEIDERFLLNNIIYKVVENKKIETTKMKKYLVYIDDGCDVYKLAVPALDENHAKDFVTGNGEVIAIKEYKERIDLNELSSVLRTSRIDDLQVDFILRALTEIGISE